MRNSYLLPLLTLTVYLGTANAQTDPQSKPSITPKPVAPPKVPPQKPTAAQEQAASAAFKAGSDLLAQEKFAAALPQFERVLALFPDSSNALWNAATAAFSSDQFDVAARYFERDSKFEPLNGQLFARLVQCYQELGDLPHRDARRAQVFAMHRSGKDDSGYTKKSSYCRDQFTIKGYHVFAFENFELRPHDKAKIFATRYEFLVAVPHAETETMRLEVGWSYLDPDGKGGLKPTKYSTFYFDAYYPEGRYARKTFGLFPKELPYEAVKQRLIDIMNDKVEMSGGQPRAEPAAGAK